MTWLSRLLFCGLACWVFILASASVAKADGRWKWDGATCYWDEYDSGPDQCDPNNPPGRWKIGAGGCYWDANDEGPDQCDPNDPPPPPPGAYIWDGTYCRWDDNASGPNRCDLETPPGDPPINDGNVSGTQLVPDGLPGVWNGYAQDPLPYPPTYLTCDHILQNGSAGWMSVDVTEVGTLVWTAHMHNWWQDWGLWYTEERKNGALFEHGTKLQFYPPHGSRFPSGGGDGLSVGALFRLDVTHFFFDWGVIYVYPYGYVATWVPNLAYGALQCIR